MPDILQKHLRSLDFNRFAFITVYNPYLQGLSLQDNQQRNTELLQDLVWYTFIHGAGGDIEGERAPEESFLVCNIDREVSIGLARKYEQNAILFWNRNIVELICCNDRI